MTSKTGHVFCCLTLQEVVLVKYDGLLDTRIGLKSQVKISTLPESNIAPKKWMVGGLLSFWQGLFSGAMLVSGSVRGTQMTVVLRSFGL